MSLVRGAGGGRTLQTIQLEFIKGRQRGREAFQNSGKGVEIQVETVGSIGQYRVGVNSIGPRWFSSGVQVSLTTQGPVGEPGSSRELGVGAKQCTGNQANPGSDAR